jgi:hypothetical protein
MKNHGARDQPAHKLTSLGAQQHYLRLSSAWGLHGMHPGWLAKGTFLYSLYEILYTKYKQRQTKGYARKTVPLILQIYKNCEWCIESFNYKWENPDREWESVWLFNARGVHAIHNIILNIVY